MFSDMPKLIERLKKYFRFRKSHKRNLRAASGNLLRFSEVFLILRVSYLAAQWLLTSCDRGGADYRETTKERKSGDQESARSQP